MADHIPGPLHFDMMGKDGPLMFFAHTCPSDNRFWLFQTAHFSAWFRAMAIDLPGFGHSPKPLPGLTMEDVAQACWEAVDTVSGDKIILFGNSLGGEVVRRMVWQRPARSAAVITCALHAGPSSPNIFNQWRDIYRDQGISPRFPHMEEHFAEANRGSRLADYWLDMILETNDRVEAESIAIVYQALAGPKPANLIPDPPIPSIVIIGDENRGYPGALDAPNLIPGCEVAVIKGANHACNLDHPWEFDEIALDFLARHALSTAPIREERAALKHRREARMPVRA